MLDSIELSIKCVCVSCRCAAGGTRQFCVLDFLGFILQNRHCSVGSSTSGPWFCTDVPFPHPPPFHVLPCPCFVSPDETRPVVSITLGSKKVQQFVAKPDAPKWGLLGITVRQRCGTSPSEAPTVMGHRVGSTWRTSSFSKLAHTEPPRAGPSEGLDMRKAEGEGRTGKQKHTH